jgi:enoyl-CoA hydratase/carnithine racemase
MTGNPTFADLSGVIPPARLWTTVNCLNRSMNATASSSLTPTLRLESRGTTLLVRVDNPPADLLDGQVLTDLDRVGRRLVRDRRFRAVIITGPRPGVFVPHYNLQEIVDGAEDLGLATPYSVARPAIGAVAAATRVPGVSGLLRRTPVAGLVTLLDTHRTLARLGQLPQVVIAAIGGDALGGGCELALSCDLRIMSEGPHLIGLPEVSAGIPPGAGGSVRLVRAIGASRALAMMLRARPLDPSAAKEAGLVDQVVPAAELLPAALRLADQVATWNPAAVRAIKHSVAATQGDADAFSVEAAGFVAAASASPALDRLREFGALSDPDAGISPWRDRRWLEVDDQRG